jgi:hypothetical protein
MPTVITITPHTALQATVAGQRHPRQCHGSSCPCWRADGNRPRHRADIRKLWRVCARPWSFQSRYPHEDDDQAAPFPPQALLLVHLVVAATPFSLVAYGEPESHRSLCPSCLSGAMRSRTNCLSSFDSGNRPCCRREKMVSPSRRTSKMPLAPGTSATSPNSFANVVNNSCDNHAARNSQRHCVQYSISRRGIMISSSSTIMQTFREVAYAAISALHCSKIASADKRMFYLCWRA